MLLFFSFLFFFAFLDGRKTFTSQNNGLAALKQELEFFRLLQNGSGYLMPRWASSGPYYVVWGPLIDQVPQRFCRAGRSPGLPSRRCLTLS